MITEMSKYFQLKATCCFTRPRGSHYQQGLLGVILYNVPLLIADGLARENLSELLVREAILWVLVHNLIQQPWLKFLRYLSRKCLCNSVK